MIALCIMRILLKLYPKILLLTLLRLFIFQNLYDKLDTLSYMEFVFLYIFSNLQPDIILMKKLNEK